MTADEFWEWASLPEQTDRRYELHRGSPVEMERQGELHGVVCALIARLLGGYVWETGKGFACSNNTCLLVERDPDTLLGPDLMYFDEKVRLDNLSGRYCERIPKLVVEVISTNDTPDQMAWRIEKCLHLGASLIWVVDPEKQSVATYQKDQDPTVFIEGDEIKTGSVLPGCRCKVSDLFRLHVTGSNLESDSE